VSWSKGKNMNTLYLKPNHIVGHRGARAEAPENTLGGFRHLRQLKIEKVELDVHLSLDQKIMVVHDLNALRTTGKNLPINNTNSSVLQGLNAVEDFNQPWTLPEPIPTLNEVVQEWQHLEHIQIEVKPQPTTKARQALVEHLARQCEALKLTAKTAVITSSDQAFLKLSKTINTLPHGLVADVNLEQPLEDAQTLGCELLVLHYKRYTAAFAALCQVAAMPVSLWTVNNPEFANTAVSLGAQSIITDCPSIFLDWIQTHSEGHKNHG